MTFLKQCFFWVGVTKRELWSSSFLQTLQVDCDTHRHGFHLQSACSASVASRFINVPLQLFHHFTHFCETLVSQNLNPFFIRNISVTFCLEDDLTTFFFFLFMSYAYGCESPLAYSNQFQSCRSAKQSIFKSSLHFLKMEPQYYFHLSSA